MRRVVADERNLRPLWKTPQHVGMLEHEKASCLASDDEFPAGFPGYGIRNSQNKEVYQSRNSIDRIKCIPYTNDMTLRDLRRDNNLTQEQLANESGVSRHAVLRMEQHIYPSPLPSIIITLSEITGLTSSQLENMYFNEVRENRIVHGNKYSLGAVDESVFEYDTGNRHPFVGFRENITNHISAIQFSIAFSIHPYTLSEYENFKTKYPDTISKALTEAGLPDKINSILISSPRFNEVFN